METEKPNLGDWTLAMLMGTVCQVILQVSIKGLL